MAAGCGLDEWIVLATGNIGGSDNGEVCMLGLPGDFTPLNSKLTDSTGNVGMLWEIYCDRIELIMI